MPTEGIETIKRTLPVVFLVDVSDEMEKNTFMEIQETLEGCIDILKEKVDLDNFRVKIMVLSYSANVQNLTHGFVDLEDFVMPHFELDTNSYLGNVINYLINNVLSNDSFVNNFSFEVCYPIIHFFSATTPHDDFTLEIEKANKFCFFRYGRKIATCFGDNCDLNSLVKITGTAETVINKDGISLCETVYTPIEVSPDVFEFGLINSEEIIYDYFTRENVKRSVGDKAIIHLCQLLPCSPENSIETVFEIKPVVKRNGFRMLNMVSVKKRYRINTRVYYCIKRGETRVFLRNELNEFSINEAHINHFVIKINENSVEIFNHSERDVFICVTNDFCEILMRDKDMICDFNGNELIKIVQKEFDSWDDDEW